MSTLPKTFWKVIKRCVQKDISNVKTRGDLIALRVYWNEDVNCIRPVFGSYTSLFQDKFAA